MSNEKRKEHILVPFISSILIVIVGMLDIDFYFKRIMFPFLMILISSTVLVMNRKDINKRAYYMLIPIILIIISNLVLKLLKGNLDDTNQLLNVFILPILISIFLLFKLFPKNLFKNLSFIKIDISKSKNKKIINIILGAIIGIIISIIILFLLTNADDYFSKFLSILKVNIDLNINIWIIIRFIIYFIILFAIGINLFKSNDIALKERKIKNIDKTMVTSMLVIVNFAFILFLISEISKLCGNFLRIPRGYIYSSYAREGFFELLFVTLINFSITLYLIYKTNLVKGSKLIKGLVISLIAFSIFLIINSYYRMFLYVGRFGFTNLRLQVILFLFMELMLFVVIIKKILKGVKNDGLIFLIIMTVTYVINLYVCNDLFIRMIGRIFK